MTIYRCANLYVIMLTYKSDLQTFHTEKELVNCTLQKTSTCEKDDVIDM